jgi:predicted site-specific integrase-resolvase
MTDRYITRHELATLYGVSTRTIDEWRRRGLIPTPTLTPTGRPRWLESVARAAIGTVGQTAPSERVA